MPEDRTIYFAPGLSLDPDTQRAASAAIEDPDRQERLERLLVDARRVHTRAVDAENGRANRDMGDIYDLISDLAGIVARLAKEAR